MITFSELVEIISENRLNTYLRLADDNKEKAVNIYFENLKISQKLYYNLHWLEIALRNEINKQLIEKYELDWCNTFDFNQKEKNKIDKCKKYLEEHKYQPSNQNIVANLSFGFWVSIFNNSYEELWRHCLRSSFKSQITIKRKTIYKSLDAILKIRNRFSHHECIIKFQETFDKELRYILSLINSKLLDLLI